MQDGTLNHALKAKCRLGIDFAIARDNRCMLLDKFNQGFFEFIDFRRARFQHFLCRWIFQQRKQQMLDGNELVTLLPRFDKCHVQADFEFLGDHVLPFDFVRETLLSTTPSTPDHRIKHTSNIGNENPQPIVPPSNSNLFHPATQWMLVLLCMIHHLLDLH